MTPFKEAKNVVSMLRAVGVISKDGFYCLEVDHEGSSSRQLLAMKDTVHTTISCNIMKIEQCRTKLYY